MMQAHSYTDGDSRNDLCSKMNGLDPTIRLRFMRDSTSGLGLTYRPWVVEHLQQECQSLVHVKKDWNVTDLILILSIDNFT
jgi:hypothetical protein